MTPIDLVTVIFCVPMTAEEVDVTHLREAVVTSSLNERQKQAVLLRYFVGLTYKQMGKAMGGLCRPSATAHLEGDPPVAPSL